jgi:hypothetical protein
MPSKPWACGSRAGGRPRYADPPDEKREGTAPSRQECCSPMLSTLSPARLLWPQGSCRRWRRAVSVRTKTTIPARGSLSRAGRKAVAALRQRSESRPRRCPRSSVFAPTSSGPSRRPLDRHARVANGFVASPRYEPATFPVAPLTAEHSPRRAPSFRRRAGPPSPKPAGIPRKPHATGRGPRLRKSLQITPIVLVIGAP